MSYASASMSLVAGLLAGTCLVAAASAQQPAATRDLIFVGARDALVTYDLNTGREIARVPNSGDATDIAVTADGVLLANHRGGSPQQTADARSRKLAMFDLSDPANPRQLPSLDVGASNGHRDYAITGDGRFLLVPANRDNVVTVVDMTERRVVRTIAVTEEPNRVASFGAAGPSIPQGPVQSVRTN